MPTLVVRTAACPAALSLLCADNPGHSPPPGLPNPGSTSPAGTGVRAVYTSTHGVQLPSDSAGTATHSGHKQRQECRTGAPSLESLMDPQSGLGFWRPEKQLLIKAVMCKMGCFIHSFYKYLLGTYDVSVTALGMAAVNKGEGHSCDEEQRDPFPKGNYIA